MADEKNVVSNAQAVEGEQPERKAKQPKPPIPTLFTIAAVLVAVALIGGSYLLGRDLGASTAPTPSATPPPAALTLPQQLEGYTLSKAGEPSTAPDMSQQILRGEYTDGSNQFIVVLTRPVDDVEKFMTDAGVTDLQGVGDGAPSSPHASDGGSSSPHSSGGSGAAEMCGRSTDTTFAACGRLVSAEGLPTTGQLIVATTELPPETLRALLAQIPR
ncbi:hypothetical protein [uncultured Tessaracoccus sp.]|uniref:hypothetical protein n=1 Tax=uncultured Tessaracoccus sp. TaxID=905023 RepID=UPI00260B3668|nr:hypothetical protein [uncultured Tessaracoccus sp.]